MLSLPRIGNLVNWYLDNLIVRLDEDAADKYTAFSDSAAAAPIGARHHFMNPYAEGHSIPQSEIDLHASRSREEVARAVMEGPALRMRSNIERLTRVGLRARRIAMVGGPSESPVWPRIVAEVTGLELKLINGQTAGAVGGAILAAMGSKLFRDEAEAFEAMGGDGTVITHRDEAVRLYEKVYEEYKEKYEHERN